MGYSLHIRLPVDMETEVHRDAQARVFLLIQPGLEWESEGVGSGCWHSAQGSEWPSNWSTVGGSFLPYRLRDHAETNLKQFQPLAWLARSPRSIPWEIYWSKGRGGEGRKVSRRVVPCDSVEG